LRAGAARVAPRSGLSRAARGQQRDQGGAGAPESEKPRRIVRLQKWARQSPSKTRQRLGLQASTGLLGYQNGRLSQAVAARPQPECVLSGSQSTCRARCAASMEEYAFGTTGQRSDSLFAPRPFCFCRTEQACWFAGKLDRHSQLTMKFVSFARNALRPLPDEVVHDARTPSFAWTAL
jgi:hypothetical protein